MALTATASTPLDRYLSGEIDLETLTAAVPLAELAAQAAALATDDLDWLVEAARDYPLIAWKAWECAPDRLSQRRALQLLGEVCTFLFGGNRSGKTEWLRALVVAFALGRDHPMVLGWAATNGLDLVAMGVPTGPGRVWLIAKSSSDSIRYHRNHVDRLLPRDGKRWNNREGRGEAVCRITVPGYEQEAEIWFKSADQGREAMQGDSIRLGAVDEECPEPIWNELLLRVADQAGRLIASLTPLKGFTWVYHRYAGIERPAEEGSVAHWLDALDNPHLPKEWFERLYRSMTEAELVARRHGRFVALEGRVYPGWVRGVHTAFVGAIPPDWPRYRAADIGVRHNSCVLWGALGPDGLLVVYRELYAPGLSARELGKRIHEAEGAVWCPGRDVAPDEVLSDWQRHLAQTVTAPDGTTRTVLPDHWDRTNAEQMTGSVVDPSALQMLADLKRFHDVTFAPARRDWRAGRAEVASRLTVLDDGRPRLLIATDERGTLLAPNLVREIESYVDPRPDTAGDTPPPRPLSGDDAMDALRYLAMRVRGL